MSSDSFLYPPSENNDSFFAPPPPQADAPSPESFDSEVDNEVGELDFNWSFDQFDDFYSIYRDSIPVNPTPALTYATDSSYDNAASQYSNDFSPSVYSNRSGFEIPSFVNDGVYTIDEFIHSAMISDYQPSFPAVNTVETQTDNGTSDPQKFVEMTPGDPPTVQQSAFPMISEQVEPFKPFKCPQCPFSSARKHNLKTHIKTHKKEDSDLFRCDTCGRQLTRKHDLTRHYEKVHGDRTSSSSASSQRFNPIPQFNRGKKWTPSAYPDSFPGLNPAAGVPEDIMASSWYKELEACIEGV